MSLGVGRRPGDASAVEADPYGPERDAWAVLASVHGLGPIGFAALLSCHGSAQDVLAVAAGPGGVELLMATPVAEIGLRDRPILEGVALAIAEAVQDADRIVGRLRELDLRVVTVEEPSYPARLAAIEMPPHVLYVRGPHATMSRERAVAVVGTRRATAAGRSAAARIATALVAADATVVSGLAFGIDGAAHDATVRAGGTTVAVIGGGHATLGPSGHSRLAEAIVASGGAVISELAPDVPPSKGTFPRRNRIISGLTDATVVIEAPASSGALITASWALEQGRGCFLVPAPSTAGRPPAAWPSCANSRRSPTSWLACRSSSPIWAMPMGRPGAGMRWQWRRRRTSVAPRRRWRGASWPATPRSTSWWRRPTCRSPRSSPP